MITRFLSFHIVFQSQKRFIGQPNNWCRLPNDKKRANFAALSHEVI